MDLELKNIKIIVSEIDGVVTSHSVLFDEVGTTIFKHYYAPDFEAINKIKKYFKFIFISKDNTINYNLCRRKNLPYYWTKNKEKTLVEEILPRYGCDLSEVLYIGSSFSDERAMALSAITACPSDAPFSIKRIATCVLQAPSGGGVLLDFYENVLLYNLSTL